MATVENREVSSVASRGYGSIKVAAIVAAGAAFVVGNFSQYTGVWLTGALMDELHYSATSVGMLLTVEFFGVALAPFFLAYFLGRVQLDRVALTGCVVAFTCHLLSVWSTSLVELALLRLLAGIGAGAVFAASSVVVAAMATPEKGYAQIQAVFAGLGVAALYGTGFLTSALGYRGIFILLAIVTLVMLPLAVKLPTPAVISVRRNRANERSWATALAVILGMFLFNLCEGSSFVFLERLASNLNLPQAQLSLVFGVGALVGIVGGVTAAFVHTRFGRRLPLAVGLVTNAIVVGMIYTTTDPHLFALLFLFVEFFWFFCLPFILGVAAYFDRSGGLAAQASGAMLLGIAVGPLLGGLLADHYGLLAIGWLAALSCFLALAALLIALRGDKVRIQV
ncbi:MFS transporter [Halioxenophilus sp. WMMB6]|uniref:MFS transporter n=1 Tax=Halioxenophilus sp. WMMB6 TaxID=3073815 RepID=UPI00295F58F7|nr:MFS transporter [Halioxenophilus sp. WMMB6]